MKSIECGILERKTKIQKLSLESSANNLKKKNKNKKIVVYGVIYSAVLLYNQSLTGDKFAKQMTLNNLIFSP